MKKYLCLMLVIFMLLATSGCAEEAPQGPHVYEKTTFVPGTMELEQLTVQPGNFDRICNTGDGKYLEIDTGFYIHWWGSLYYAEKDNPDIWYYVCDDPDCSHTAEACSASIKNGNTVWYNNGYIYFLEALDTYPEYRDHSSTNGFMRMRENGNDIELVQVSEHFNGSCIYGFFEVVPGGYLMGADFLLPDGSFEHVVYLYEEGKGERILYQEKDSEEVEAVITQCGQHALLLCGDFTVQSYMFTQDASYKNVLFWFHGEQQVLTDISEIPVWGGYLQGSVIRCFDPGKGYFDVDLLTGERTKLADAQLENSKARILQPNCIIETTLLNPESEAETQEMRFFDGQQWHAVTLPDDLLAPDGTFEVVALASDRVIFSVKRHGMITSYYGEDASVIFYQMKLDGETYTVEYMGTFQKPYIDSAA